MRKLSVVIFSLCLIRVAAAQTESPVANEAARADSSVGGEAAPTESAVAGAVAPVVPPYRSVAAVPKPKHSGGIHWGPLFRDWWVNLVMDQTVRIVKEPKTRNALSGPFFHDWFHTVSTYHFTRWNDDDKFITSNLGHPAQGAIVAAIFWQNDDHVRFSDQDFHSAAYRKALLQSFLFVTFDAVQWKLGPLSESSIGNVGLPAHWWEEQWACTQFKITCEPRTGLNDLLLNEFGGTAMIIGFQWLDKHVQKRIERHVQSRALIDTTRMLSNPPQSVANIVRGKVPWFRDNRP
jgi:hypothetical protein